MMDRPSPFGQLQYDGGGAAVMDDSQDSDQQAAGPSANTIRLTPSKGRSLSDGGGGVRGTPSKLSPAPLALDLGRKMSKDDNYIRDTTTASTATSTSVPSPAPMTPKRAELPRGFLHQQQQQSQQQLNIDNIDNNTTTTHLHQTLGHIRQQQQQLQQNDFSASPSQIPVSTIFTKPAPLSPKLDHSHTYASPTNILPRRSRGLDFSRAATSLHHSTLAESSPDSSPTVGAGRAMNIPDRRFNDFGNAEQSTSSLWSMMGNQERMNVSSSLGSAHPLASDSSSSDEEDLMDEDMEDAIVTTPQVTRSTAAPIGIPGSPAINSLSSFHQRQRHRKQPKKKKNNRGPLGLGFTPAAAAAISKSPPSKDLSHHRRESISWQANQLHISGTGSEEERTGGDGLKQRHTIMRQVAARRGNLMPKTKGFARIKHALLEEGAPIEAEVRREAEVVRQVRESDVDLEPRIPTAHSSPSLANQDANLDDVPADDIIGESGLSSSFKQQALKNFKGPKFWDTFSESSSIGARTTPPPTFMPRGSSSGVSEDINMDSPSLGATAGFAMASGSGDSTKGDTGTPGASQGASQGQTQTQIPQFPPTAAEITRRINNKRRRDDDFDPNIFKRRAVSPGMSVHNSPITQSPMQRDVVPWGSRPSSNNGDRGDRGGSGAPSEAGSGSVSMGGGTPGNGSGNGNGNTSNGASNGRVGGGGKGRIGFQGMSDTHDGLMRMSIE